MDNKEVNERMQEVSRELAEMRFHWVQIYDQIMQLIHETDEEEYFIELPFPEEEEKE